MINRNHHLKIEKKLLDERVKKISIFLTFAKVMCFFLCAYAIFLMIIDKNFDAIIVQI